MIDEAHVNMLIADLARAAAATDNGAWLGQTGAIEKHKGTFHEGGAKAYRHAIATVIKYQRWSRALARESEQ